MSGPPIIFGGEGSSTPGPPIFTGPITLIDLYGATGTIQSWSNNVGLGYFKITFLGSSGFITIANDGTNDTFGAGQTGSPSFFLGSLMLGADPRTTPIAASALLDMESTTQGLLPPRMTNAQMLAIASPVDGLVVYATDSPSGLYQYDGGRWLRIGSSYGNLAADPLSPPPSDGDTYFNTVLQEIMRYDGARGKWLTTESLTLLAGRQTDTAPGSFYRGQDGLTFGPNIGYQVPKGTLVGLAWSRSDSDAAVLEVLVGGTVIATMLSSSAGAVSDWTVNADFNEGLLQFRNQAGSNPTSDVQITAILKRRV